jgi:hypothetical protein
LRVEEGNLLFCEMEMKKFVLGLKYDWGEGWGWEGNLRRVRR